MEWIHRDSDFRFFEAFQPEYDFCFPKNKPQTTQVFTNIIATVLLGFQSNEDDTTSMGEKGDRRVTSCRRSPAEMHLSMADSRSEREVSPRDSL